MRHETDRTDGQSDFEYRGQIIEQAEARAASEEFAAQYSQNDDWLSGQNTAEEHEQNAKDYEQIADAAATGMFGWLKGG